MDDQGRPAPMLPYDELRSAIGDDPTARNALDALHAHVAEPNPDPARIEAHVGTLRGIRDAEAQLANWWDDPATQRWFKALGDTGL